MKAWKFKIGIIGVFVLGVIVGVVGTGITIHYRTAEFGFTKPEQVVAHIMRRLTRELNLTDEQTKEIAPIVLEGFTKMRTLRNRLTPEVEALIAESTQRIKQHLDAEQQRRFDSYNAKMLQHWRQFAGPPGPAPPAPVGGPPGGAPPAK